jgi:hypothetical protein
VNCIELDPDRVKWKVQTLKNDSSISYASLPATSPPLESPCFYF